MFTGIIEAVGKIKQVTNTKDTQKNGLCLDIASGSLSLSDVAIGDSIAVNGVCLTVTHLFNDGFSVDVSRETLNCSCSLDQLGARVNLEKAMRLSDRLGGHLVSGHVDCTGEVVNFDSTGECYLLGIKAPEGVLKFIANKGSITVNGVSLTVNQVNGEVFYINLIPHTLAATTLNELKPCSKVNLETDMLARYVARLIDVSTQSE
ncbi:MAG: riboflavin synthase [Nitrosomonas sp.]|nr:riboflavin synthase [Nitrosomonas sp.]